MMENEKRLIYAEDAKRLFDDIPPFIGMTGKCVQEMLDKAPTVDAVEVVRCKDCRWARAKDHREPIDTPKKLICQCFMHHHIPAPWGARMAVNHDDFCSYGERKENDGDKALL